MKHLLFFLLALCVLATGPALAQSTLPAPYFITAQLGPYQQNFDSMGSAGTPGFIDGANTSLPGILAGFKYGTSFGSSPSAAPNDGTNVNSTAYNFGTTGQADRALGGMAGSLSGFNTTGYVCVRLRNRSKTKIRNFDIRYALEQWYNSSNAQDAYVLASYRVYKDTTSFALNDIAQDNGPSGWADIPDLKLLAPATSGQVGKADGNSTTYRRMAQYRLTNIDLDNGQEIVVRFSYIFNSNTNGNGVSVDDISIYPETNVLYSSATGALTNTANDATGTWTLLANGSTRPARTVDFSTPNCTYYVQGSSMASRFSSWQVTGANSRVVVGTTATPAALYLAAGDNLAATVDVAAGSTLSLGCTPTGLVLGSLATGSTVQYTGNTAGTTQLVLPATYAGLSLSGSSPKSLTGNVTVAERLALSSASSSAPQAVQLGSYNLTLLRKATLSRTNGGQVITNGTGEYRATVLGAGSGAAVLFPVALSAAAGDYLPVSITSGLNDLDDTYRVRVVNGVYQTYSAAGVGSNPVSNPGNVNNTWHISHETTTPVSATLDLDWDASREGSKFVRASSFLDHYDSGKNTWDAVADNSSYKGTSNGRGAVQRKDVGKFSPFAVTSNSAGPLPVVLLSFEAKRAAAAVVCTWATASEQYNDHFVVERSLDGTSFEALGQVAGQGTSTAAHTYTYKDARPVASVAYYRLRQVDADGTATFSPVVAVQGSDALLAAAITAVPNPSTGQFALLTSFEAATQLQGSVMNMLGQKVLTVNALVEAGSASLPLDLSAQPAGVYLVQLNGPAGASTLRLLKQ